MIPLLREYWILFVAAATAAVTVFYIGYYNEIGFAFIGLTSTSDIFYNVAGISGLTFFFGYLFHFFTAILNGRESKVIDFLKLAVILAAGGLAIIFIIIGMRYRIESYNAVGFFFIFLLGFVAALPAAINSWPITRPRGAIWVLGLAFASYLLIESSGKLYAHLQFNFGDRYDIYVERDVLVGARILRSSSSGIVYFLDGRVSFVNADKVRYVHREKKFVFLKDISR
jgi:hypothetical protein